MQHKTEKSHISGQGQDQGPTTPHNQKKLISLAMQQ